MAYKSNFLERYSVYMDALELLEVIEQLELAYAQTSNEIVYRLIQQFRVKLDTARKNEIEFNRRDYEELINNPELYPFAVRIWPHIDPDIEN